jgi:hypothetical protein
MPTTFSSRIPGGLPPDGHPCLDKSETHHYPLGEGEPAAASSAAPGVVSPARAMKRLRSLQSGVSSTSPAAPWSVTSLICLHLDNSTVLIGSPPAGQGGPHCGVDLARARASALLMEPLGTAAMVDRARRPVGAEKLFTQCANGPGGRNWLQPRACPFTVLGATADVGAATR